MKTAQNRHRGDCVGGRYDRLRIEVGLSTGATFDVSSTEAETLCIGTPPWDLSRLEPLLYLLGDPAGQSMLSIGLGKRKYLLAFLVCSHPCDSIPCGPPVLALAVYPNSVQVAMTIGCNGQRLRPEAPSLLGIVVGGKRGGTCTHALS